MFSQDTVMKRISKSTLKLWRKQARENVLGRESRGRKACPAFETALLSELLYVSSVHASDGKEGPAEVRVKANAMFSYPSGSEEEGERRRRRRRIRSTRFGS